jgi:EmrB/QacA subfamily drug resistance transporter
MTTSTPAATAASSPPSGRRIVLIMVSLVLALVPVQLDGLVTATATPTLAGDLGGLDSIAWVATAYLLTMAIGTVLAGRLGDMFGRKWMLLAALGVFFIASAWAGSAGSMGSFIAARAAQGLGAGMTFTTLLATVADIAPPEKRGRYQGVFGAIAPLSMIVGPWVGGIITDSPGWRWIFFFNLPLIALSIAGAAILLRLPAGHRGGRVDIAGLGTMAVMSVGVVLAVTWGGHQYDWLSPQVLGAAIIAVLALVALVLIERRAQHPILPPALFRSRAVLMSLVVLFLVMGAIMMASVNFLPLFLQLVQGASAANSGLLLLPMLLPAIGVALLIGRWTTRGSRFRTVMIIGTAVTALACVLIATMGQSTPAWATAGYMVLIGGGIGLLFQTPLVLIQNSAPASEVGAATGAASFLRMLGGAVGVGALGALFTSTVVSHVSTHGSGAIDIASVTPDQLDRLPAAAQQLVADAVTSGNSVLFWVAAVIAGVAVIAALLIPARRPAAD